jgi:hypothetical protein
MTAWPVSLTRSPLESLIGKSHPLRQLDEVFAELVTTQGVPTNLPFVAQTQTQTNWCWAAVATSVGLFYGTGNWTQCGVATEQVNKLIHPGKVSDCCATPGSSDCNVYGYVYFSLQQVRSVDHWSPTKPPPQEIYERLSRNKELVCLRIRWNGSGNAAHFTTIRGCTDPSDGGPFIVSTSDTLEGFSGSTLPYDDLPTKYHGGGEWTDTFWTSGRFAPATSCGSAESAALDVNNNGNCVSLRSRAGDMFCSVGKVDHIVKTVAWTAETGVGKGIAGGIGIDDAGNCVLVHSAAGGLFFRTGLLDAATGTITWQAETSYGTGSANAIAMMEHAVCLEAHIDQGKLYSNIGWLRGDGGIDWGEPDSFGNGGFVMIAADIDGTCVELHSGVGQDAGNLFCTPGAVDLLNSKVKWGKSVVVGAGSQGSVSLGSNGQCVVTFVDNGSVYSRSGQMDAAAGAIEWFPELDLAKGEATAISIDDLGRGVETHVAQKALFCALGRQ